MLKHVIWFALAGSAAAFGSSTGNFSVSTGSVSTGGVTTGGCSYQGSLAGYGGEGNSCKSLDPTGELVAAANARFTIFPGGSVADVRGGSGRVDAFAYASVSTDDFYYGLGPFAGTLYAVFNHNCDKSGLGGSCTYTFGNGGPIRTLDGPFDFGPVAIPVTLANGQAEVIYSNTASYAASDATGTANSSISVARFQDSQGNPVASTLVPEPSSEIPLGLLFGASILKSLLGKRRR